MIFKTKKNKINKIKSNQLLNILKNIFSIILLVQIFLFIILTIWYLNNPVKNIYPPDRLLKEFNLKTKNFIGFEFKNVTEYAGIYLKGIYYKIFTPDIERIKINIKQKNLLELEIQRKNRSKINSGDLEIKKKLNKFINATLELDEEIYKIKLRVKGDRKIHFYNPSTTSYKIDIRGNKRLWGFEEFSVQKPVIRNYSYEYIFQKLNKELGNISLEYKLVDLWVNGVSRGIYSIEEGFSKELLERNSKRNGPIYGVRDDILGLYPNIIYDSYSEVKWMKKNNDLLKSGYAILNGLKDRNENISNYIDWESWAKFFAVVDMSQAYHGSLAKSVRIYYNPVSGKIEPISYDGHYGTADFSNFIILDFINKNSNCSWICGEREWFMRFLFDQDSNPRSEFIEPYLKYLNILISDEFLEKFQNKHKLKIEEMNKLFYSDFSKHDNILWQGLCPYVYDENFLEDRAKKIRTKLASTDLSNFIFSKLDKKLMVKFARKSLPIKLKSNCNLKLKKFDDFWISSSKTITWKNDCKDIVIETVNKKKRKFKIFDNPVLNTKLPIDFKNFISIEEIIPGKKIGKNFYPQEEKIFINQNIKIPKNINLVLKENQKIFLKNSSTIVFFGDVKLIGSDENKILIQGIAPGYGSIISLRNNFFAKNLILDNLISPKIEGLLFYGGMNIVKSNVILENVTFLNSKSEDALNLIDSLSDISNLIFQNTQSDALDVDSGSVNIKKIFCKNIGNDCLDFSNSNSYIDYVSTVNILDKSISVGEKSNIKIKKLDIDNSEIGVAVKDNSETNIELANIKNTSLPIAVFVKKNEYGPAKLTINQIKLINSNNEFLVDNRSSLKVNDVQYKGTKSGSEIESYLYGNVYGKATSR